MIKPGSEPKLNVLLFGASLRADSLNYWMKTSRSDASTSFRPTRSLSYPLFRAGQDWLPAINLVPKG